MKKLLVLILSTWVCTTAYSQAEVSVRDRVATFLTTNVMGRSQLIETQGTMISAGKNFNVDFKATVRWSGLQKTDDGLLFQERREVKQTNIQVDAQGLPISEPVVSERTVVHQYALTERRSTGSLVGLTTVLQNTDEDPTGSGFVTMIEISADQKELYIYESMAGFVERSLDGVNEQPVSIATASTMYLDTNAKLVSDQTIKFYKVDVNKDFAKEEINRFNMTATEISR